MSSDIDLHNKIFAEVEIENEAHGATSDSGNIIDTDEYYGTEFLVLSGGLDAPGTVTFEMKESDSSNFAPNNIVDPDFIIGDINDITLTAESPTNEVKRIGYAGKKRFVLLRWTASVAGTWGAIAVKFMRRHEQTPNN